VRSFPSAIFCRFHRNRRLSLTLLDFMRPLGAFVVSALQPKSPCRCGLKYSTCKKPYRVDILRISKPSCLNKLDLRASQQKKDSKNSKLFAFETNGDVLKFGVLVSSSCLFCYWLLLQVFRVSEQTAGLVTTGLLTVFGMGLWTFSYFSRVANKEMTYVQQLREYEDKVLQRRLDELSETELQALLDELQEKPPTK